MRRKEISKLLKNTKKYGTKVTAVAIAATLALAAVPVETLASESVIELEVTSETDKTEEPVEANFVTPALETVEQAKESVTDAETAESLENAADKLEEASSEVEIAEERKEEVEAGMVEIEEANAAFVAAIEEVKTEEENARGAADEAVAAKDIAVSAESESEAQEAATAAGESANNAQAAVDAAQEKVDTAQEEYNKAYAAYQEALRKAEEAEQAITNAGTNLEDAAEAVNEAKASAEEFQAQADAALEEVNDEGMSLILAQRDKVAEICNAEGKTENYWAATRTLNNMIIQYYLLSGNTDVATDTIRFGAEYDDTEFSVITDYEKNDDGTYKVDENGNYIPVYSTISYRDNTKDDTGEINWIKADSNQSNRTVCVYEEQVRDEQGALLYDAEGNPVMRTVVKYYNYKTNNDGTIYIMEKIWNVEDTEEIIAEVPAVDSVEAIAPTYEYVSGEQILTRDENDGRQIVKTMEDGTEVIVIPDESDNRGTLTNPEPTATEKREGNTIITTTYEKDEETTTYEVGGTQVINKNGAGATQVRDCEKSQGGSKDDMKKDVDDLLQEYDLNAGYAIEIEYTRWNGWLWEHKETCTIDNYADKAGFWDKIAGFFGALDYNIKVTHTEDTVEGIVETTCADYKVTTTEVTQNSEEKNGDGYASRDEARNAAEAQKQDMVSAYRETLGESCSEVWDGDKCILTSADGQTVIELHIAVNTEAYRSGFFGLLGKTKYKYDVNCAVTTTKTTTSTENRIVATKSYGAQYYNYTMTNPGREGVPAVAGKEAAYGTKIVWTDNQNEVLVNEKSTEYQEALAEQEARVKEYTDAVSAAADALDEVSAAQEAVDEAKAAYNNMKNDSDTTWATLREYEALVNAAKEKLEQAVANAQELQEVADEAKAAYEEAVASLERFAVTDSDSDYDGDLENPTESDTNRPNGTTDSADTNTSGDSTDSADTNTPEASTDSADANTSGDSTDSVDSNTSGDSTDSADANTSGDSTDSADSNTSGDPTDSAENDTPNEITNGTDNYVDVPQFVSSVPQVADVAAVATNIVATGRTVATDSADEFEENLVTIDEEEVPLAAEKRAKNTEEDTEIVTIDEEEVPLAVEKDSTQKNFLVWILIMLAMVAGVFFVVIYQRNKKKDM